MEASESDYEEDLRSSTLCEMFLKKHYYELAAAMLAAIAMALCSWYLLNDPTQYDIELSGDLIYDILNFIHLNGPITVWYFLVSWNENLVMTIGYGAPIIFPFLSFLFWLVLFGSFLVVGKYMSNKMNKTNWLGPIVIGIFVLVTILPLFYYHSEKYFLEKAFSGQMNHVVSGSWGNGEKLNEEGFEIGPDLSFERFIMRKLELEETPISEMIDFCLSLGPEPLPNMGDDFYGSQSMTQQEYCLLKLVDYPLYHADPGQEFLLKNAPDVIFPSRNELKRQIAYYFDERGSGRLSPSIPDEMEVTYNLLVCEEVRKKTDDNLWQKCLANSTLTFPSDRTAFVRICELLFVQTEHCTQNLPQLSEAELQLGRQDFRPKRDPVWSEFDIDLTQPANVIIFNIQFIDTPLSEGVFRIYFENEVIGTIYERNVGGKMQTLLVPLPDIKLGQHKFRFRLDALNAEEKSSVKLENVRLAFIEKLR